MASLVAKYIFKRNMPNLRVGTNPYYTPEQLSAGGRSKRKFKDASREWSEHDRKLFKRARRRAYRMDESIGLICCNARIGWSAVIGLLPFVGDLLDLFLALRIVAVCSEIDGGLPEATRAAMYANVAVDFAVGLVPLVGDVVDAMYKANTRNIQLLEKCLDDRARKRNAGSATGAGAAAIEPAPAQRGIAAAQASTPNTASTTTTAAGRPTERAALLDASRPDASKQTSGVAAHR